jgi:hypothetical protein
LDNEAAENFKRPEAQTLHTWFYNVSNPSEYFAGATAELDETGVYGFDLQINRGNLQYKEEGTIASFNLYNEVSYDEDESCSDCERDDELTVFNFAYNAVIGAARSEALLMMSMACTTEQIGYLADPTVTAYCTEAQRGTSTKCKCCVPATSGVNLCGSIALPTSTQGRIFSLVSKYDNGLKIGSDPDGIADGQYSALLVHRTPFQVLHGLTSPLTGYFTTKTAMTESTYDADKIQLNAEITEDLKDICYTNLCSTSISDLLSDNTTVFNENIRTYSCDVIVPNYKTLISDYGIDEDRASELRYLEGSNCNSLSAAFTLGALVEQYEGEITCVNRYGQNDSSVSAPCCPKYYSYTVSGKTYSGSALGCLAYIPGLVTERPSFSNDEAVKYIQNGYTEQRTGCGAHDTKFDTLIYKNESTIDRWFVPDENLGQTLYVKSNSWADPYVVSDVLSGGGAFAGTKVNYTQNGKFFSFREGRGVTGKFLDWQLTSNGKPKYESYELFNTFSRGTFDTVYVDDERKDGVELNKFVTVINDNSSEAYYTEMRLQGQQPYPNMQNMVYTLNGRPIIMSQPNFHHVDSAMLSQSDNTERYSSQTTGVNLYRVKDGYGKDAKALANKTLITNVTLEDYSSLYDGYMKVEPATGATISGSVTNMISTFTWNCNPLQDSMCKLKRSVATGAVTKCYSGAVTGLPASVEFPCSAYNVFAPSVHGGKVTPIFWISIEPEANYVFSKLRFLIDLRQGWSVLILIVPIISAIAFLLIIKFEWYTEKSASSNDDKKPDDSYSQPVEDGKSNQIEITDQSKI